MRLFAASSLVAIAQASGALAGTKVDQFSGPEQTPSSVPIPGVPTSHGCYNDGGSLTSMELRNGNLNSGLCLQACQRDDFTVMALHGNECLCGMAYPPRDSLAEDENCDYPCPSYPLEACGGLGSPSFYSVFNTGVELDVPDEDSLDENRETSSSSSTAAPSTTSSAASEPTSTAHKDSELSKTTSETSGPSSTTSLVSNPPTATTATSVSSTTTPGTIESPAPEDSAWGSFDRGAVAGSTFAGILIAVVGAAHF